MNMKLTKDQKAKLKKAAGKHGLILVVLFGSYARGTETHESDFDVAVLSEFDYEKISQASLIKDLTPIFERDIDLTILNRADPVLKFQVARNGILLYGSKKGFTRFKVRSIAEYMDTKKLFNLEFKYIKNKLKTLK